MPVSILEGAKPPLSLKRANQKINMTMKILETHTSKSDVSLDKRPQSV